MNKINCFVIFVDFKHIFEDWCIHSYTYYCSPTQPTQPKTTLPIHQGTGLMKHPQPNIVGPRANPHLSTIRAITYETTPFDHNTSTYLTISRNGFMVPSWRSFGTSYSSNPLTSTQRPGMQDEHNALKKIKTWLLPVQVSMWYDQCCYLNTVNAKGSLSRCKTQLFSNCWSQQHGIKSDETFLSHN